MTNYLSDMDLMQQTAWETRESVGVAGVDVPDCGGQWTGSAAHSGTPEPTSWRTTVPGSLDHLGGGPLTIMVTQPSDRTADPRRCDCADWLRSVAAEHANNSRDFGRGFMHAARELERRCA